jgi:hypothetical protein
VTIPETLFVNEMRLTKWQWLTTLTLVVLVAVVIPRIASIRERFIPGQDYRIPYELSQDYWLYEQWISLAQASNVIVLGDSVIWGEYVQSEGTLSHQLGEVLGQQGRFVNGGLNGLFPLAMEGLIRYYGDSIRGRRVILHCNLLWMSSPKSDLQTQKEERFNHTELVPQFLPGIPSYHADANARLSAVIGRNLTFLQWIQHLQVCYFGRKSMVEWTLEEDGTNPLRYPNAYKNPLAQIHWTIPTEPSVDPMRGPGSPRHKPWSAGAGATTKFEWVDLDRSLQWGAFLRLVAVLQSRGNDVLVLLGPFNEHIIAAENRPRFLEIRDAAERGLRSTRAAVIRPETLPSEMYADASHPLTQGYLTLAKRLIETPEFVAWLDRRSQ